MENTRTTQPTKDQLELRLNEITVKFEVDRESLFKILQSPLYSELTQGLSKNQRRKFKRYFNSREAVLEKILPYLSTDLYLLRTEQKDPYEQYVLDRLSDNEVRDYNNYNWSSRILDVVSDAQKRFMIPERAKSYAEVNSRVKFVPTGEYRSRDNR